MILSLNDKEGGIDDDEGDEDEDVDVDVDEDGDGNHDDGCIIHFCKSAGWSLFPWS